MIKYKKILKEAKKVKQPNPNSLQTSGKMEKSKKKAEQQTIYNYSMYTKVGSKIAEVRKQIICV